MNHDVKLRVSNIEKSFPGVKALDKIEFSVRKGTVHVLCGENGAGKSTLMKIINGIYQPDSGQILIDGKEVKIKNPIQARHLGISMIFQELNFIPEMTIEESLFVGNWPKDKFGKVDWPEIRKRTLELLRAENLNYKPDTRLKDLTVSDIQMLEILKAISYQSDIIIMDEPTSAITQKEVDVLFRKIFELKSRGAAIIYISHKMDEIFKIADDITVFRDGKVIDSKPKEALDIDTVISLMVGRKLGNDFPKITVPIGESILSVEQLCGMKFKEVSFDLRKGEIIGFAGLMGAGRTEVMRAIFGLDPVRSGKITMHGKPVKIRNVKDSIDQKVVMLTEDRRRYGILPVRSVRENISITNLSKFIYKGKLHAKEEFDSVKYYCDKMKVKTPTYETAISSLSGGNQQKVLLAKWLITDPEVFIVDEPTRGIDVGAKYEIYKLISDLVSEGKSVIMVSSELPELIGMCDRIVVMAKGEVMGILDKSDFSQENIMRLATSTKQMN
ncbi:MAG TPA: D-xylose ABC transporter ATP-binding protein [Clostridiales bacterium UBA8960]|jgi:inositol transport system ATP-binding protein|nr:D-xylose ABC transporter ATP-binding protein [Clostridiales bacterium UBA8960]